jgi:hypothetical protein
MPQHPQSTAARTWRRSLRPEAGASLLFETGGGLCWAAAGIVAITGAVANAWVLLIEILR